jgi:hypothetical protein
MDAALVQGYEAAIEQLADFNVEPRVGATPDIFM